MEIEGKFCYVSPIPTGLEMLVRYLTSLLVAAGFAGTALAAPNPAEAPALPAGFERFAAEIEAFAARDLERKTPGDTLFVGSSSIRLWDTAQSFPRRAAMNRGFGGATTPDVLHYYGQVVARYQPASIIVYVGENDIAAGAAPETVSADVLTLLTRIRKDNPRARIAYLSMKPSPSRWNLWAKMDAVNNAVRAKSGRASFDYLDVGSALLNTDGMPDRQFFTADGLHMNASGYSLWTAAVDAYLGSPDAKTTPGAKAPAVVRTTAL